MNLLILAPICSVLALAFAGYLTYKVLKEDEGTDKMKKIAKDIRKGADAYLKRQYTGVAL
ncbi:MAG: sodium/proton-translocating pyrophosphatase, partial [Clostridiaceae bacterium]|nr:sodium/proton-translocating pyrophosphatase [Clostridiaceae bacterium]